MKSLPVFPDQDGSDYNNNLIKRPEREIDQKHGWKNGLNQGLIALALPIVGRIYLMQIECYECFGRQFIALILLGTHNSLNHAPEQLVET